MKILKTDHKKKEKISLRVKGRKINYVSVTFAIKSKGQLKLQKRNLRIRKVGLRKIAGYYEEI